MSENQSNLLMLVFLGAGLLAIWHVAKNKTENSKGTEKVEKETVSVATDPPKGFSLGGHLVKLESDGVYFGGVGE